MVALKLFLIVVGVVGVVLALVFGAMYRLNKAVDQSDPGT